MKGLVLSPVFEVPSQSQMIKLGSSQSLANIMLTHDKEINDLQIGLQIKKSPFNPDASELFVCDLSETLCTMVSLKPG